MLQHLVLLANILSVATAAGRWVIQYLKQSDALVLLCWGILSLLLKDFFFFNLMLQGYNSSSMSVCSALQQAVKLNFGSVLCNFSSMNLTKFVTCFFWVGLLQPDRSSCGQCISHSASWYVCQHLLLAPAPVYPPMYGYLLWNYLWVIKCGWPSSRFFRLFCEFVCFLMYCNALMLLVAMWLKNIMADVCMFELN